MTRLFPALAAATLALSSPPTAAQTAGPSPALHVDVVAVDDDGRAVTDLAPDDLDVRIGAYRLPVESLRFSAAGDDAGRALVLLLDDVTLPPAAAPRVREIARRFVDRMVPGDGMAIVTLSGDAMEMTGDRARLIQRIQSYTGLTAGLLTLDRAGRHVLESYAQLSRQFGEAPGRKVVVAIGADWLFDTPIPPPNVGTPVREEWSQAMRALAAAHASVYVIDPGGLGPRPSAAGGSGFARETGGLAFVNTNDFKGAVEQIMRDAAQYYEVGIANPPVGRQADLRRLEVRSLRRGVTVRARRWLAGR